MEKKGKSTKVIPMSFSSPFLHFRSENLDLLSNVASQKVSEFNKGNLQTHVDNFKGGRIQLFQKKVGVSNI